MIHGQQADRVQEHRFSILSAAQEAVDQLDRSLATFAGRPGGPHSHAWQRRQPAHSHVSKDSPHAASGDVQSHFPQAVSLSAALLLAQLRIFSRLLALAATGEQEARIEALTAAVSTEAARIAKSGKKGAVPLLPPCVAACALKGLPVVAKVQQNASGQTQPLADAVKDLATVLLSSGPAFMRPGASCMRCLQL